MTRHRFSQRERAAIVAEANAIGPAATATKRGLKVTTVTAMQSKARANPEAFTLDPDDVEELAGEVVVPEGASSFLAELEQEQREALEDLRRARREGKPTTGPATTHAIAVDKVLKLREAERDRPAVLGDDRDVRVRLAALRRALTARRLQEFATLDVDELRVKAVKLHGEVGRLQAQHRALIDEMGRRQRGDPSIFARVAELDEGTWPEPWRSSGLYTKGPLGQSEPAPRS